MSFQLSPVGVKSIEKIHDLSISLIKSVSDGKPNASLLYMETLIEEYQDSFDEDLFLPFHMKEIQVDESAFDGYSYVPKFSNLFDLCKYSMIISKNLIPKYMRCEDIENYEGEELHKYIKWTIFKLGVDMKFEDSDEFINNIFGKVVTIEILERFFEKVYEYPFKLFFDALIRASLMNEDMEGNRKNVEKLDVLFGRQQTSTK